MCKSPTDLQKRGVGTYLGALVFTDVLGQARCGFTGVLRDKCACYDFLHYGITPPVGYRGQPSYNADRDGYDFVPGQRPLALPAGLGQTIPPSEEL